MANFDDRFDPHPQIGSSELRRLRVHPRNACNTTVRLVAGLLIAISPVYLIAQPARTTTVSLSNLVNTRAVAYKQFQDALASGASAADIKDLTDLANTRLADVKSSMESSHLFTEAQIAGVTGENGVAYFDNLIASVNPAQHPELQQIIDQGYEAEYALIDLRLSQANANPVALERARATLMARQQMWHILFAPPDPTGTSTTSVTTDEPPAPHESSTPELTPNAPAQPTTPQVPQVDPTPDTPPTLPRTPTPVTPVRKPTVIPNNAPDPATQKDGERVPVAPPPRTGDDSVRVNRPVPTQNGQPVTNPPLTITPIHIPIAPVVGTPAQSDDQSVAGPVSNPYPQQSDPNNDPVFVPQPATDLGLPTGQTLPSSSNHGDGSSTASAAAAAAAGAGVQGTGTPAMDAAAAAAGEGAEGGNGSGSGSNRGGTPIAIPPSMTRPGRVGVTDQSGTGTAAIVSGIDNGGGTGPSQADLTGIVLPRIQLPPDQGSGPVTNGDVNGVSLAPVYSGYSVHGGDHGSTVIAVPTTQVQTPSPLMTAPSTQVPVTSTQIRVPSSQVNVPSTQVNVPSTQIRVPSTQVNVPSTQITVPSTQIQVPSSVMTSLDLQPALCGR